VIRSEECAAKLDFNKLPAISVTSDLALDRKEADPCPGESGTRQNRVVSVKFFETNILPAND
jgi:hypothetical protein